MLVSDSVICARVNVLCLGGNRVLIFTKSTRFVCFRFCSVSSRHHILHFHVTINQLTNLLK